MQGRDKYVGGRVRPPNLGAIKCKGQGAITLVVSNPIGCNDGVQCCLIVCRQIGLTRGRWAEG